MARLSANRLDSDGETVHAAVAHEAAYSIELPLYHRRAGNGTIYCRLVKAAKPAKRIVQLVAEYSDAGVDVQQIVQCENEADEIRQLERLERVMVAAARRPSS